MERIAVKSSNIAAIGFDPATETMEVEFIPHKDRPAAVHQYAGVPYDEYRKFLNAPSVGIHFHEHIKARYPSHRVDSDPPKKEKPRHGEEESKEASRKRIS